MSVSAPWSTSKPTTAAQVKPREPYGRLHGAPTELYEQVHPEMHGDHSRKGYFRNPDFAEPRKPPPDPNAVFEKRHPKVNTVSANAPMPPSYQPGAASGFMSGLSAPARVQPVYGRTVDETWEKLEDFPNIFEPVTVAHHEFVRQVDKEEQIRKAELAKQKAKDAEPPKPSNCHGPWSDTRVRLETQPQKAAQANRNRRSLTKQMNNFEEKSTDGSFVGTWAGRAGGGAPTRRPDGTIEVHRSNHFDIHAHNSSHVPNGVGIAFEPHTQAERDRIKSDLDRQVAENRERRKQSRARDQERITLDDGGLVLNGSRPSPTPRKRFDDRPTPDLELGQVLRAQAVEQRSIRNQERQNARSNDVGYQPFGKDRKHRAARVNATKGYGMSDVPTAAPVEGGSLMNVPTWGTPGGGAVATHYGEGQPRVLPRPFHGEEEQAEIDAQAQGQSVWGRPGAGAAIRNPDGSIRTNVQGVAERDVSGMLDSRRQPEFQRKTRQLREEQAEFLRQKEEAKKRERQAELEQDRKGGNDLLMLRRTGIEDHNDLIQGAYGGGPGRYARSRMPEELFPEERATRKKPDFLREQIADGERRRAEERHRQMAEEARHVQAASALFPTAAHVHRRVDPITQEPSGRLALDPMLHVAEYQGKLRLDPNEQVEYKAELDRVVEERNEQRRAMRERKRQEEFKHGETMEESWQTQYRKQDGRRKLPQDQEYKMLVRTAANLA